MSFAYSLYPHAGDWRNGVCPESRHYALPFRVYQTMGSADGGTQSSSMGFCSISDKALVVSCFKRAEDRPTAILRIYNPTPEAKHAKASFAFPLKAAWEVNLNEKRGKQIALEENGFEISCPQNKILTFEIEWALPCPMP